jgi:acetyl esterase/lipase
MNRTALLLFVLAVAGCGPTSSQHGPRDSSSEGGKPPPGAATLAEVRRGFQTKLTRKDSAKTPIPPPPPNLFRVVRYESPAGKLGAYLGVDPKDGKKHPAIIWIFGGFGNDIDDAWTPAPAANDQSARAFREAGLVMMYPSLRGGNDGVGSKEGFFGEVDDVLAAADFLAKQYYVDPDRIYLGGHSTGGTLALLAGECGGRFRAVFSFGPVSDVAGYGPKDLPFNVGDKRELELRAPGRWLSSIQCPTFVFEGTKSPGNLGELQVMSRASKNPLVHFHAVNGATHFTILAPATRLIAGKILRDDGTTTNIAFTEAELNGLLAR